MVTSSIAYTPRDLARVFFRHRRKMVLFFCTVVALTLAAIALSPRSYSSRSILMIRVGRESVGLDPTATTGETISLQKSQTDEVNSALEILSSRSVLERVVDEVGVDRILKDEPTAQEVQSAPSPIMERLSTTFAAGRQWIKSTMEQLRLSDRGTDLDLAVRRLETGIDVSSPKQSTIISVAYSARSPELAHDIVKALTDAFLDHHLEINRTEGSLEFFTEQVASLREELDAKQSELRDRKNEFQLTSSESGRAILEQQIATVELERLQSERELAFSNAAIESISKAISALDPELVTNRVLGFPNEAKSGMRQKLYDLELRESELKARYTDEYPLLVEVRKQLKAAKDILAALPDERTQITEALNPNQRSLELKLTQSVANHAALEAKLDAAVSQHTSLVAELTRLNDQELQLARLERTVELLDGTYRMHFEKMEQARVNEAMGFDGISNLKVAQPATLVSKPDWPKKPLMLALGLLVATGGAFGLALASESMDQTLRTTDQVEAQLGVPVVLSMPFRSETTAIKRNSPRKGRTAASQADRRPFGDFSSLFGDIDMSSAGLLDEHRTRTLGVVGCGATTIRSRIALELAKQAASRFGQPVLLIDADSRRRRISRRFRVGDAPGWQDVLAGVVDAESCVHRRKSRKLAVMGPGGTNGATATIESSLGVLAQFDEVKTEYDLVVVDVPDARDAASLPGGASMIDEAVLVVEAERTRIQAARQAIERLRRNGILLKGVILANRRDHIPEWVYKRL